LLAFPSPAFLHFIKVFSKPFKPIVKAFISNAMSSDA
jgi:hypothetical protein